MKQVQKRCMEYKAHRSYPCRKWNDLEIWLYTEYSLSNTFGISKPSMQNIIESNRLYSQFVRYSCLWKWNIFILLFRIFPYLYIDSGIKLKILLMDDMFSPQLKQINATENSFDYFTLKNTVILYFLVISLVFCWMSRFIMWSYILVFIISNIIDLFLYILLLDIINCFVMSFYPL